MKQIKNLILYPLLMLALLAAAASGAAWYWSTSPVTMQQERIDYIVAPGASPRAVARLMLKSGIDVNEEGFVLLARLSGLDKQIQAGAYEALQGDSPRRLLERMVNGDMTQARLTLVEGWTYQRIRQALREAPQVKQTLEGVTDQQLLKQLGAEQQAPEGLFYPDTYVFVPGSSDFEILRRAYEAHETMLTTLWAERDPKLPLTSPYEALVLASIVEKETGHEQDRRRVAGVFINRLRLGMPLQTDPTVIYGMGEAYQGRIRKKDLTTDTAWNTYTRAGLPPTPIASPGRAALAAVVHPESHDFLYFVSRGDGTSEFSSNLASHNRAVSKYILGQKQ
ncbi:endolytic transglycosylase MltG [Pusillimonas sp. ANT_WB101]|uniref:endolytic transglycosylase MltG n=1 Tax=Pusillimonas sp. ANT_WB101 TaxID=2597356 RepID=UPI0011ECD661|nr:endolytic transglycosylase MltG [Pusillimonas sp. ANT_WB101]KAA0911020.1 endolytic transglycosylase MltG [Pusillimonas sp. ANT_WB101]